MGRAGDPGSAQAVRPGHRSDPVHRGAGRRACRSRDGVLPVGGSCPSRCLDGSVRGVLSGVLAFPDPDEVRGDTRRDL